MIWCGTMCVSNESLLLLRLNGRRDISASHLSPVEVDPSKLFAAFSSTGLGGGVTLTRHALPQFCRRATREQTAQLSALVTKPLLSQSVSLPLSRPVIAFRGIAGCGLPTPTFKGRWKLGSRYEQKFFV